VVVTGLLIVAGALWLLSTVEFGDGYGLVAATLALLGIGMGLTVAPATESIMGSLPLAKAGVSSAMNDTTRQVGGALGVAVLGSILAASYDAAIQPTLQSAPPQLAQAAGDSIGAATTIAAQQGPAGQGLLEAARWPSSRAWAAPSGSARGWPPSPPCWCCCSSQRGQKEGWRGSACRRSRPRARCKDGLTDDFLNGLASLPTKGALQTARKLERVMRG
jgi:hypothetical protein